MISSTCHTAEELAALNQRYGALLPDGLCIMAKSSAVEPVLLLTRMAKENRFFFDLPDGFVAAAVCTSRYDLPVEGGDHRSFAGGRLQQVKDAEELAKALALVSHDPKTGEHYPWLGAQTTASYLKLGLQAGVLRAVTFRYDSTAVTPDAAVVGVKLDTRFVSLGMWAVNPFAEAELLRGLNQLLRNAAVTAHHLGLFTKAYLPRGAVQRDASQIKLEAELAARALTWGRAKSRATVMTNMPRVYGAPAWPGCYQRQATPGDTVMKGRSGSVRSPGKEDLRKLLHPPSAG